MATRASRRVVLGAVTVAGAAALAIPAAASAATAVVVNEGDFAKNGTEFTAFYPKRIVVPEGGSVRFNILGFHTLVIPKKGQGSPFIIIPTPKPNPATNDPAGVAYWWSGKPGITLNPATFGPSGGTTYDGSRTISSGFVNGNPPKFTVKFTKAGTYQVRCAVHPGMTGTVVVTKGGDIDALAASAARRAAKAKAADLRFAAANLKKALALPTVVPPPAPGSTTAGPGLVKIGPGNARGEALNFFPKGLSVPANTDVIFRMAGATEFHTVTFGPTAFVGKVEKSLQNKGTPEGAMPSDDPALGPAILSPTSHGNGFVNSGIMFDKPITKKLGQSSFTVRFTTPGVYSFHCMIHPEMKGKITVT
jgi:plastocyanin